MNPVHPMYACRKLYPVFFSKVRRTNPETLGSLDTPSRVLNALLSGVNSRSSGLSAFDVGLMYS